jgi:hypothetical protein
MGLVNQAHGSFPPDWSHSLVNNILLGVGIAQPDPARLAQIERLHALARDVFYGRRLRINARELWEPLNWNPSAAERNVNQSIIGLHCIIHSLARALKGPSSQ